MTQYDLERLHTQLSVRREATVYPAAHFMPVIRQCNLSPGETTHHGTGPVIEAMVSPSALAPVVGSHHPHWTARTAAVGILLTHPL